MKTINADRLIKSLSNSIVFLSCLVFAGFIQAADPAPLISTVDAFDWASIDADVYIIDVRTDAEWKWVGHPGPNDLVGSKPGNAKELNYNAGEGLEGKVFHVRFKIEDSEGNMSLNPNFLDEIEALFEPGDVLLTICRSGKRANAAALELIADEYEAYNIENGFEGPTNNEDDPGPDTGYRDVSGWVNDGLPWTY